MATTKKKLPVVKSKTVLSKQNLFKQIKLLVEQSRARVYVAVNAELVFTYWKIGSTINQYILQNKRAGYGEQIIAEIAEKLQEEFGKGFNEKTLRHCLRSAETFTEKQIVSAVRRQLSWTHLKSVMYFEDALKREFYLEMSAHERWSSRQLQERIDTMMYERTAISKKPKKTIQ